jgi:hypothetical protein
MQMSREVEGIIKAPLSFPMNDDDAAAFSVSYHPIAVIKEAQTRWQTPASIGMQAAVLHLAETDTESVVLQDLIACALDSVEASVDSLVP